MTLKQQEAELILEFVEKNKDQFLIFAVDRDFPIVEWQTEQFAEQAISNLRKVAVGF